VAALPWIQTRSLTTVPVISINSDLNSRHYTTTTRKDGKSERRMAPYLLTKTENIPHPTICGKGYADSLLGKTRSNFEALHAQGEPCDQYNVCRSPKKSPASCNQVQTPWTSKYRCFASTWQSLVPYCPFNCFNNSRLSTSAVLARPRLRWLSCLWTTQKGDVMQVFQVWRRGVAGGARAGGCTLNQKNIF
jgi:hypothetical protein